MAGVKQIPKVSLQAYFRRRLFWEFSKTWSFIGVGPGGATREPLSRPAAGWSPPPCGGSPGPRHGCSREGLRHLQVRSAAPAGYRAVPLDPQLCWGSLDLRVCSGRWLGGKQLTFWGAPLRSWKDPCSGHLKHLRTSGLLALRSSQCSCFLLIILNK